MLPVVSIVGKSGAGKTTLIERLIAEFKKRGYQLATVKHSRQKIDMDKPGKDSWKFAEAGSDAVVISSPDKLAFTRDMEHDPSIEEILRIIGGDFDFVLIEGFRKSKAPKIEVHRKELGDDLLCQLEELSAIVTDGSFDTSVPQLSNDTQAVADFIEKNFVLQGEGDTMLFVNGKRIPMHPFVKDIIARVNLALASTLKGVGEIRNLDISIINKPESIVTLSRSSEQSEEASKEPQAPPKAAQKDSPRSLS
jgi:molybdopterin-guanine dinucleotide biosynthesis protein MobB